MAATDQDVILTAGEDATLTFTVTSGETFTVMAATAADPVAITTDRPHGLSTGAKVTITGCIGLDEANVTANAITVASGKTDEFTLDSVDGSGGSAYTGGGVVTVPTNLTGADPINWAMRTHALSSADSLAKTGSIVTAAAGTCSVTVADTDTDSLEPRAYFQQLKVTDSSGNETVVATGTLSLLPKIV